MSTALAASSPEQPEPLLTYHVAKRMGRPTSLTPALLEQVADLAAEGHYIETVCGALKIPRRTCYHWLERGEADCKNEKQSLEAEFWLTVKEFAVSWGEIDLIREAKSGKQGWAGPMTVASRRHREHWQDKEQEGNQPKVVIQIGVGLGDVKVGIINATFAPPTSLLTHDLHSLTGHIESNTIDYVNQSNALPVKEIALASPSPIGDSPQPNPEGDPTRPAGAERPSRTFFSRKGRSVAAKRKKAPRGV